MTKMGTTKKQHQKYRSGERCETTGVRDDNEITGLDRDNESTGIKSEPGSTGATNEAYEMALIEEAISEAKRDIAEGTELLAGNETET